MKISDLKIGKTYHTRTMAHGKQKWACFDNVHDESPHRILSDITYGGKNPPINMRDREYYKNNPDVTPPSDWLQITDQDMKFLGTTQLKFAGYFGRSTMSSVHYFFLPAHNEIFGFSTYTVTKNIFK